ncbi:MAG: hypothetical protein E7214_04350 [Clostridium sp.]|nr:hypothetical protein [Clostridium sp.]
MLKNLIKYEFKATSRILLPLYGALVLFSIINNLFGARDGLGKTWDNYAFRFSSIVYSAIMVAIFVMTFVIILQRFYNNLLQDEGYLMHTLPVTTAQNIWAKVIVSTVWVIGSGLVSLISVILLVINVDAIKSAWDGLGKVFEAFIQANKIAGGHLYIIPLEMILLLIVSIALGVLVLYASMCIGHLVPNHRILGSFGGFMLINIVWDIIVSFVLKSGIVNFSFWNVNNGPYVFELNVLFAILSQLVISAILFIVCNYILEKKLNLE